MENEDILKKIGNEEIEPDDFAEIIKKNWDLLSEVFKGLDSTKPEIKYSCAKVLRSISEENPEKLYAEFDFFVNLLGSNNKILNWIAIDVLGNLTKVDTENKFDTISEKFFHLLTDQSMITAVHTIENLGKIAKAKPHLTKQITDNLLKIESTPRTQECKNILFGKAIVAFSGFFDQIANKDDVISFARKQLNNPRKKKKKIAEKFLKKFK